MKAGPILLAIALGARALAHEQSAPSPAEIAALHRAVFELPETQPLPDADKAEALARLYAEGTGVPRDPVMACTLFDFTTRSRMDRPNGLEGITLMESAQRTMQQHCGALNAVERQWAYQNLGCPVFGLPRGTILDLGPGWWVKFDGPAPVIVEFGGKQHQHEIGTVGFLCRAHVVLTRHTMVADADRRESQARHFVEMGTWRAGCCAAAGMRVFTWRVFEVKGGGWQQVADEQMTEPGSIFPAPADRGAGARFTRLTTGQIGYELVLDTPRRGVLAPQ